jgi:hypothetical protein
MDPGQANCYESVTGDAWKIRWGKELFGQTLYLKKLVSQNYPPLLSSP